MTALVNAIAPATFVPSLLIADDDPAIVQLLTTRCEKLGFKVDTATNGIQLLIKARQGHHDVMIIDVNMPELDGISASARILDPANKSVEIIIVSGGSSPQIAERCDSLGMFYSRKDAEFWHQIEGYLISLYPAMIAAPHGETHSNDAFLQKRPRVLIVDDDPAVEVFLSSRLGKFGIDTIYAPNATTGVRMAARLKPSVIISDYDMPDGDAQYLLSRLRATAGTEKIPVFVLSGLEIDEITEQKLRREILGQAGALHIFKKSFDIHELFQALEQFCAFEKAASRSLPQ
ncbi:MAG: response regulator [Pseudolabrys sp.]|nr:response regulator [Pseudolabrys sp.]